MLLSTNGDNMIHNRKISQRCYQAKQNLEQVKLVIVSSRSFPDYEPETIEQKLIPSGSD
jgi:hypothetical protein